MNKKIYLGFSLLLFAAVAISQVRMEKSCGETFEVTENSKVEINNKYGEVIVQTWDSPQVKIAGKLIANGRNEDVVNKTLRRVNVDIRQIGDLISVDTDIEKRGGTFTELFGEVEEYSRNLFGNNKKLTVNIEVWLPKNIDMSITNKYGDVYLATLSGEIDLTLGHGDLKADRIEGRLDMEHSYGKATFNFVNRGRFNLRGTETTIEEGSSYSFQSSSSEIELYNSHYVKLNSRNDKVKIRSINEIVGIGRFTDLNAEGIVRNVDLKFDFGEINLSNIEAKFKTISLETKSTDVNLTLNQASYIDAEIKGDENKMIVPNSMLSLSRAFDEETEMVVLSGMVGPTQSHQSSLKVNSSGGDLIISIKDIPVFSDRR